MTVIDKEIEYRRKLMDQFLGGPVAFNDHVTESSFKDLHVNWLAPQCAVLEWLLEWMRTTLKLTLDDLEPFLELGAFTGHLSGHLATAKKMRGVCSDLETDFLARSVGRIFPRLGMDAERLELRRVDAERIDALDNTFGLVFIFSGLHHFEDPDRCLLEIRRVLRPGGVFVCAFEPLQPLARGSRVEAHQSRSEVAEGLVENVYRLSQYDAMLRKAFDTVHSMPLDSLRSPHPWLTPLLAMISAAPWISPLRRGIIRFLGGQDYSAVARKHG